jgi:hypothetical protein
VGVTGSTTLSAAEAWDYCWRAAEILEGLKNKEADQDGNPFTPSLFLSFNLFDWLTTFLFAVLANNLKAAQKALSNEKSARLRAENSLAEEKAVRQAAAQSLQQAMMPMSPWRLSWRPIDLSCCYTWQVRQ